MWSTRLSRVCGAGMLTMLVVVMTTRSAAQDASLPDGRQVLAKYVEATGGRAAYESVNSRISWMTMELPAMGVSGKMTIHQLVPDRGLITIDFPGTGTVQQGTDGRIAWEQSAMMGARLLEGQEAETVMRGVNPRSEIEPEKVYQSIQTMGVEEVDGKPAYKVELTTPAGGREVRFYDKDSGLLVKSIVNTRSERGEFEVSTTHSDYKDMGGIKVPTKLTQQLMGQTILITIDKIELNPTIPPEKFDLPPEVKALLEKQQSAPATQPR